MAFKIHGDRVESEILEISAVDQCNLSCQACSHFAPVSDKRAPSVESTRRQVMALARFYHAGTLRILGGEPLLRSDLVDFTRMIRETGIADRIRLVTNGTLLDRITPYLLKLLTSVEISVYPGEKPDAAELDRFSAKAREFGVLVHPKFTPTFYATHSSHRHEDSELRDLVYRTCKLVHSWGCHTLYDGHFFKCSHGAHIDRQVSGSGGYPSGIPIHDAHGFGSELMNYLRENEKPLPACDNCLGALGKEIPHQRVERGAWRDLPSLPIHELLHPNFRDTVAAHDEAIRKAKTCANLGTTEGCYPDLFLFD